METSPAKKKSKVFIPLAIVILAILAGAFLWYRDYSIWITTDDAHIDADNFTVSSKMLGRIVALYAKEGDTVMKGQLLVELDSSDLVAQKNQAIALRNQALSNIRQAETKYASDQEGLKVVAINLEKATEDLGRAQKQSLGGVITQEQYDHIKKAYEAASAQVDAAKAMLSVSKAQVASARSASESADAQIRVLETQLRNTKLYSPEDGIVAKRWLLPGDIIQAGQSAFTLINDREEWVLVYLVETKIADIHDGPLARCTIDAYPHVRFFGRVYLLGSSTASVFSLIPPNNASGNFTKVTQRIPLRISIDSADTGRRISSFNILSGMSAVVKIRRK